jgi:hypothetical protein
VRALGVLDLKRSFDCIVICVATDNFAQDDRSHNDRRRKSDAKVQEEGAACRLTGGGFSRVRP